MLVLSRKLNEKIIIGDSIEVKVLKVSNGRVKLGIDADSFIDIRRAEIDDAAEEAPVAAQTPATKEDQLCAS